MHPIARPTLALLTATLLAPQGAAAAPVPTGPDGRLGLADVLHCYGVAQRIADHDPACDDDEDGRVGIADALVWYAIARRVAPQIVSADRDSVLPGVPVRIQIANVSANDPDLSVAATVPGRRIGLDLEFEATGRSELTVRVPIEAGIIDTDIFVRVSTALSSNRLRLRVGCAPGQVDLDGDPANECEYACARSEPPVETCNGLDDDCNRRPRRPALPSRRDRRPCGSGTTE